MAGHVEKKAGEKQNGETGYERWRCGNQKEEMSKDAMDGGSQDRFGQLGSDSKIPQGVEKTCKAMGLDGLRDPAQKWGNKNRVAFISHKHRFSLVNIDR